MRYRETAAGEFVSRPNRFVAKVLIDGRETEVHVKNTGRCKELLVPGARVYLEDFTLRPGKRKLLYDLIAVEKGGLLINMDSQAPNKVVREALENGTLKPEGMSLLSEIRQECVRGDSRFDFFLSDRDGRRCYIEVKGVTLENNGVASFPDAPTERGLKHIRGLVKAVEDGCAAWVIFVVQMSGMSVFVPNDVTHKAFGDALRHAVSKGVGIKALECAVTPDTLEITGEIPVDLR